MNLTRIEKTLNITPVITQVITPEQIGNKDIVPIKNFLMQVEPGLGFQEVGFGTSINMQRLDGVSILSLIGGRQNCGRDG